MIALGILILILLLPVGVDGSSDFKGYELKLTLGPFRIKIPESDMKLTFDDIMLLLKIILDDLKRFREHLVVELVRFRWTAASDDPYNAVVQYGRVNSVLGMLSVPLHRFLFVRNEDVRTEIDFSAARPHGEIQLVLTMQIWELLMVGICTKFPGTKWYLKKSREMRAEKAGSAEKECA